MTSEALPTVTAYQLLGGEVGIRALVRRFYELMDTLPEAYAIRQLHPASLAGSEDKLFMYLSGWLGGPQLYVERFGHPRLRARHLPFPINGTARDQWLMCMRLAMADKIADDKLRAGLDKALADLADHMCNQAG
jgi:hemoglobin